MKKKVNFKLIFIIILISMFNLKSVFAKYDKVFFDFKLKSISGDEINLSDYKGKTVLLVNVASRCGFTKQYDDLQKIWDTYKNKGFVVVGIPSNQFGSQEPGTNEQITEFCSLNYGNTFPIFSKIDVNGENAHPLFNFLINTFFLSILIKSKFLNSLIGRYGNLSKLALRSKLYPKKSKIFLYFLELL